MSTNNSVVAISRQRSDADLAIRELQRGGVKHLQSNVNIGKGYHTG